jgi:hypothetical protein
MKNHVNAACRSVVLSGLPVEFQNAGLRIFAVNLKLIFFVFENPFARWIRAF